MTMQSRRYLYTVIAFVVAAATTPSNARLAASPGQPPSAQTAAADISPEAFAQIEALIHEKDFRSEAQQKIDSQLISQLRMERGQPIATGVLVAETDLPYAADGHVVVDVKARVTDGLIASLTALGIEVLSSDPDGGMLRVHINIDQVDALAALPDVSFVQPKQAAQIHQAAPNVLVTQTGQGSRSSQGDITHLAYAARAAFGATGSGIKIGVLSDGVTNLATSQASGDLGPVTVLAGQAGSGDEGTAMLEIIHDLAPGAQLYFATAFTSITSFANNIRALRAAGCDIIVDDVAYFVETPFQDGQAASVVSNTNGGVVIQAVNDVTADGALYFSSAGNSGHLSAGTSGTWEGDFADGGATSLPVETGRLHSFGPQNFTAITIPAAGAPTNLSWSDPLGGSANDYDLFRLNSAGTAVVASSTNIQSGTQDPYEQLSSSGIVGERIVIVKKNTAAIRFLHLGTNRGVLSIATAGETHGHAAAAGAFDVAATPAVGPFPQPFNSANVVERFSSDGPRRVFFEANGSPYTAGNVSSTGGVLRQKPDITAADGVSVTGAGGFPSSFFGTSAAAPHAAAIAGLLKSANPALTPAQIRTLLTTSAIDIGVAGADRDSGAGIVMADAVMRAAGVPGAALLEVTTVQAVDNPGNGNGAPEAGEGVRLIMPLANYGGAPATAVSATLTSSTPGITITQPAIRTYPDLAIAASGSAPPYFFTVASDFPCPQPASFTLTVTSAGGPSPRVFSFQVPIGPPSYSITTTLDTSAPPGSPGVTTATGLQTPRLTRNGVASSCSVAKAAPALFDTGTRQFDAYAFNTCASSVPSCVTVTLQGTNAINLFSAAYSPTFVANNLQQNYQADAGASGSSRTYGFNLAGGAQTFVVDVHEVDSGLGIGTPYTLTVAGACGGACTPNHVPVAIAKDVTVPAGASGTAEASIDNGSSDADGDPLTLTQSPAGPYPIGQTTVLLTVSDPQGATSQATAVVTVVGPTTTTVSASPNPSFAAQPVAFTATVTTSSGGIAADGSVTFQEGPTVLAGPTALSGGQAIFLTSSLSVGAHTITAFYSSSSGVFVASHGSIVQQVVNTPVISIADASVLEGNSGTVNAQFHVTLSNTSPATVTVHYATADQTATAPADYTAASGLVSFAPGEVDKIVTVLVIGDTILDGTETFLVNLTAPSNGTLVRAQAVGTILDDDAVSEAAVTQAVSSGSARLQALQRSDGGWFFMAGDTDCGAGPGVSCRNTVGNTALGLLAGYTRTGNESLLRAATAAGDYLVTLHNAAIAQSPPTRPHNQDIEFLVALGQLTGNALYTSTAQSWFQIVVDQFPNAADRIDLMLATRDRQHVRSLAAWDAGSLIRAAKAAGNVNYALAAATRIRDREVDWKDTNPAHRFDQCQPAAGCGPPGNLLAFDYTIAGEGSLLWAIHDLPGFDAQIAEYRSFLVAQQDPSGSWDVGDSQITAYVVLGLAAVGGIGTSNAIPSAAAFSLGNQLPSGGWPSSVVAGSTGSEYSVVDAEIVRAISTLFNTPAGSNVSVAPAQLSTVTFSTVSTSGLTSVVAVDHSAAVPVPSGFEVIRGLDYNVLTTASVAGDTVACFLVSWITDAATFADVRILHEEHGVLVDRTILAPGQPAPNFANRQVCARVSSLTTFALALRASTPPDLTVTAVNHAPVAEAQGVTMPEDTATAITLTASDVDGDTVTYRVVTPPAHGTLIGTVPTVTYTPAANYNGADNFTFTANDGTVDSAPATVSLTITAVNDAPVAAAQALTTPEETATAITLTASDVDGDTVTYRVVTAPAHGTLSGIAPTLTYTPAADYKGVDSFTFKANDGTADSAAATVSLTMTARRPARGGAGHGPDIGGRRRRPQSGGG